MMRSPEPTPAPAPYACPDSLWHHPAIIVLSSLPFACRSTFWLAIICTRMLYLAVSRRQKTASGRVFQKTG
ncbi:hypothetical protein SGGMMB4_01830 [Sodalis glossinidius str. 'morsitans']|uniref:Uncharacterized protein n=1 Tax=Sodalis glossinidius (strain morsitans) TaxID=343509 RepID=A0A193QHI7_SODGM|nr:hypothetical protein SGGMMB4_01830 [Sodalis glossinidius str. 'morsitans']